MPSTQSNFMPLSPEDVARVAKELKKIPYWLPLAEIALHWVEIVVALVLYYHFQSVFSYALLVPFIAAQQYALLILLHDGQHTLLNPIKKVNDSIAIWLIAAPCGTFFASSQRTHLDHHHYLGERERDPDYHLYCTGDPLPKHNKRELVKLFLGRIGGGKLIALLFARPAAKTKTPLPRPPGQLLSLLRKIWPVCLVQCILLMLFTVIFGWYGYLLLWFLPLVILTVFFNDFRIFCEHSNREEGKNERLITYVSHPIERFFLAPNHMNYHAEHHFFPYVPHSNLPALRRAIQECSEYSSAIQWRRSYIGHLLDYLKAFS